MDKTFFTVEEIYSKGLISIRLRNTLHRSQIFNTYHLAKLGDKELKKLPDIGAKALKEI